MSFEYDRFLVDQVIRPVANLYRVTPLAVGETPAGSPIAYVRQKKLAIKEDIRFYADEEIALARERSVAGAIGRRVVDFVPYVGGLVPIPYNFEILLDGEVVGAM